jgi:PAS domain S-box-containing protein
MWENRRDIENTIQEVAEMAEIVSIRQQSPGELPRTDEAVGTKTRPEPGSGLFLDQGSEKKLGHSRDTVTAIPDDFMTLVNRDYTYEFASDTYCSALGKSRHNVLKNSVMDVWGEENFSKVIKKHLDRCFAGEEVHHEGWLDVPGQGLRYCHASYYPYYNDQGGITHAVAGLFDNTERKAEEEALKRGEAHFRMMLKHMHFGVFSFDAEGRFTFVNDVVAERTGYPREWFAEKSLFDFVRREEREEVRRHFEASVRGALVPPYEFAYYDASGNLVWVEVNTTPIREGGQVVGVLGVLLDITRRKKSDQALKESEEKFRMLFEDSRDAIFIANRKGMLTDVNRSFLELFGYEREEAIGLDVVNTYVDPDERSVCVRAIEEKGFVKDFELKLKKSGGSVMDCLLTGTGQRDAYGTVVRYQGIIRDVTEQKRMEQALSDSEQKLANILYGSPIPQFVIDKNHTVTHWNKALELLSGIKAEEVVGTKQHWRAFYRSERPCIADLLVDTALEEAPQWYGGENRKPAAMDEAYRAVEFFRELGDKGRWLYFTAAALRDSKGKVAGALETLEDVTDHKHAEDAIRKAAERYHSVLTMQG